MRPIYLLVEDRRIAFVSRAGFVRLRIYVLVLMAGRRSEGRSLNFWLVIVVKVLNRHYILDGVEIVMEVLRRHSLLVVIEIVIVTREGS
jgi:hypothetical protein